MSVATTIAREALENRESISDTMRRHGLNPMTPFRAEVIREVDRLRESYKPPVSEMRRRAQERQVQVNGLPCWR